MNEEVQNVVLEEEITENDDAQTSEETVEGVELTDTAETEKVEEKVEEQPKGRFVTDDEINELVDRRVRRKMEKYEKEMNIYKDTSEVVKRAVGGNTPEEINSNLRGFYQKEGYELPERTSGLTEREEEVLARDDANQIIEDGYDAMVEEAERLSKIGYKNMSNREKVIFNSISEKLTEIKDKKELLQLGANEELLKDADFKAFRNQFNSSTPMKTIYELYSKNTKQKTAKENPGSMKNNTADTVKEYYTPEEIAKLTEEDLDKPGVYEAVRNSMTKNRPVNYYE